MTPEQLQHLALLQQSAADMVRILEEMLCRAVPAERRSGHQHSVIYMARKMFEALAGDGDIKDAAGLEKVALAAGKVVGRRVFVAPASGDMGTAELQGGW